MQKRLKLIKVLLLLILLGAKPCFSQFRIIDTTKTWNVLQSYNKRQTLCYKFFNDTVIQNVAYTELKFSYSEKIDTSHLKLAGFVREDTSKGKVYIRFNTGETFLLYNFKAQICDIINLPSYDFASLISFQVEFADTFLVNGVKRRRLFLESLDKTIARDQIWVEGIGSTVGLIETCEAEVGEYSSKLLCCKSGNEVVWQSPDNVCYYSNVDSTNNLVFKRNKSDDKAVVMPLDFSAINLKIRIYSLEGKEMVTKKIKNKNDLSFEKMPMGTYLIEILDFFDKIYYTKKVKI